MNTGVAFLSAPSRTRRRRMTNDIINNELEISWPEGFHRMSERELRKAFKDNNPNRWGIMDEQRHMMITVLWNRTNMLSAMTVGPKTVAYSVEHKIKTSFDKSSYHFKSYFPKKVSGRNAYGFRYEYMMDNVVQLGEVLVTQNVNCYYTIYTYALKVNKQDARKVIDSIFKSLKYLNDRK